MLKLISGHSKSGKTEYVRNYLSSLAKQGEDKLLMIVPDQQSFDTEKFFLRELGPVLSRNITVLGFSRLCDYIFSETNCKSTGLAEEADKVLVMSYALKSISSQLKHYDIDSSSPQFVSLMLETKTEFSRSNVSHGVLSDSYAKIGDKVLSEKLHDISLIFNTYDALLTQYYQDPDGALNFALDLLKEERIFEGYNVCIDSYLSFTEPEFLIVEELMRQSKDLLVTASDDGMIYEDNIFGISQQTLSRLRRSASDNNIDVSDPVVCDYNGYFTSPELVHIEENIFRSDSFSDTINNKDSLKVYVARDRYDEADYVARNIRRLVMEEGYRYNDFAVVSRSLTPYEGILDFALEKYNISYFMDTTSHILSKPLMKLVSAVFDVISSSFKENCFTKESVLSVVKSGLVDIDSIDAALFENYIFTWSITGKGFFSEFTANPRGFADEFTTEDMVELSRVEKVRKKIIMPLYHFRQETGRTDGQSICVHLYNLLLELGVDKQILRLYDSLEKASCYHLAQEQLRLWDILIDTLDRTSRLFNKVTIPPKEFAELLELQFASQKLAFIPHSADQVTVGDIERLRLSDKKVVFVIGAVEDEFPASPSSGGLFSDSERLELFEQGLLSDPSVETHTLREKYLCYYALTSASDKLLCSYPAANLTGTIIQPSVIVTELLGLFDNLTPEHYSLIPVSDRLWAHKPSFNIFAERVTSSDGVTQALRNYYSNNELYKDSAQAVTRAAERAPFVIKDKLNAEKLFGSDLRLSASQVEQYHNCRFRYFLNYGLALKERRPATMDAMEYGSFVHYILEYFIKKYDKEELLLLRDSEIKEEIRTIMDQYAENHMGGLEDKTHRFRFLFNRVGDSAFALVRHLINELSQSSFVPQAFELDIGNYVPAYKLTLANGNTVTIRGKVDRADVYRDGDKTYLRIVDYKTGKKEFELSDVMYGLNMQMLIYLSALTKNGGEFFGGAVTPAGVLYMPAIAPVIDAAFNAPSDKIAKELNSKLRMNGLILNDTDILKAMEKDCTGVYIPVSLKGDDLKGLDNLATLEQFGAIFSKIDSLISQMEQELHSGTISPNPASDTYDACKYCPYSSVCGHSDADPVRDITKLDRDQIISELGLVDDKSQEVTQ